MSTHVSQASRRRQQLHPAGFHARWQTFHSSLLGRALGRFLDGGRTVAVKVTWLVGLTEILVVLKLTTGLACTIVCTAKPVASRHDQLDVSAAAKATESAWVTVSSLLQT